MTIHLARRFAVVAIAAVIGTGIAATALGILPAIHTRLSAAMHKSSQPSILVEDDCWFDGDFPVSCAWLRPERQNAENDTALPIVILHRNAGRTSQQASIYLSGGPGGSSFLFEEGIAGWIEWRDRLGLDHDLVLYDSRGTGYSEPVLECRSYERAVRDALAAPTDTPAQMAQQWSVMEGVLRVCANRVPVADRNANLLSTPTHARDLLELSRELRGEYGYDRIVLYGASYGSRLAVAAARMAAATPGVAIERVVLDAYYPPGVDLDARLPQTWSEVLDDYAAYCASGAACDGALLQASVQKLLLLDPASAQVRDVTLDEGMVEGSPIVPIRIDRYYAIDMLMHALSFNLDVEQLPLRAQEAAEGRWTPAWQALARSYVGAQLDWTFSPVAFNLVECADNGEVDAKDTLAILAAHREFASVLDYVPASRGYCERFGVRPAPLMREPVGIDALVTSMRLDPVTPWRAAHAALADLPRAQWRMVEGAGHGAADSDECAGRAIGAYMNSGDLTAWESCRVIDDDLLRAAASMARANPR